MARLSNQTLAQVGPGVRRPGYDRAAARIGVVHFGPGAFHRAHQAFYFDEMLGHGGDFAVSAVSLRSGELAAALAPQDGLYTLVEREAEPGYRVIGAIQKTLVAARRPEAVFAGLASPDVRIVTATVTEKGYCLTPGGELDLEHPDVRNDLQRPAAPRSFPGWLLEGLVRRRTAGLAPPVVISCDNLSGNGDKLAAAVASLARARGEADLSRWVADAVRFPNSMVDSITPATDAALRAEVAGVLGLEDAWPVQRERFVQWVVEDGLSLPDRETFEAAGVTVPRSVAPFERAKLRLLNGAHSTLAYVGLELGHETVADAMADPRLAGFVERMMREDIAPTVAAPGLDVPAYITQVLGRFRNCAVVHRLSQIAWDGSQKLRFRLLETVAERLAAGRQPGRLATGVAAWMLFVRRRGQAGAEIVDPLAAELGRIARRCDGSDADVDRFLASPAVFPDKLGADPRLRDAVTAAYRALQTEPETALR